MDWETVLTAAQAARSLGKGVDQFFNELRSQNPATTNNNSNLTDQRAMTPYGDPSTGYNQAVGAQMDQAGVGSESQYYRTQNFNKKMADDIRQQNQINTLGINDQQYRANAANNMLNAYTNARTANQQFLSSLAGQAAAMSK